MHLYHGSTDIIKDPRILEQQRLLDFGKGFYLTSNKEQAERWALIKKKRNHGESEAIVTVFLIANDLSLNSGLKIKRFETANEEWLDFVLFNRSNDTSHGYDVVTGPVANDTLYQTLTLFEAGILTKEETINRLKVHRLFDQISLHTHEALACIRFIDVYKVEEHRES